MGGKKEAHLALITMLIVLQVYSGLLASVTAADDEHSYIMFQDDFEDGDAEDWTIDVPPEAPIGSTWAIELEDNNHFFSQTGHIEASAGDITWTDYTLELKIKLIEPMVTNIIFRNAMTAEGFYYINLNQNKLRLMKSTPNIASELYSVEQSLSLNTWHTIKIICVENRINTYVDDVLKLSYVDEENPHLCGKFMFELGNYYDDVKVSFPHSFYVSHLIQEVEDEIIKEGNDGADTLEAEEKWMEAQDAFDNGNTSVAESLTNEALYLAQHAQMGAVSVNDLLNYPTTFDNHTLEISGTMNGIQYEQGLYRFAVDDGIAAISVTFDGTLEEITNEDDVKVVGTFDALTGSVSASNIQKITITQPSPTEPTPTETEPTTPEPTEPEPTTNEPTDPEPTDPEPTQPDPTEPEPTDPEPTDPEPTDSLSSIPLSIEWVAAILSLCGLAAGAGTWIFRTQSARKRNKILFNKLMEDIDDVYSRFRMNTLQCESELYKYKNQVLEDFKQGLIDEDKYNILDKRIINYLMEIKDKNAKERTS